MGKPLGKPVISYIPEALQQRLDEAVKSTKTKTRSKMLEYIIEDWCNQNGF
jgi:metal-responsive CopG/Arc/MetJ family transcriptional regulator